MYSQIKSSVCKGIDGKTVVVEADISKGLPGINVVGLASATVMESKERIKSAIINSGLEYPRGRITINLMPADLRKDTSCLDLPMAIAMLDCSNALEANIDDNWAIIGELSLDGRVMRVNGLLSMMMQLCTDRSLRVIVPYGNVQEALLADPDSIYPVRNLRECVEVLQNPEDAKKASDMSKYLKCDIKAGSKDNAIADFKDIGGQEHAKRAMLIAATGRHGLLMVGSPGCGKSMLASRLPGILPPMSQSEIIETAMIRSISGQNCDNRERPFRHPHHTIGRAGFLGGGTDSVRAGEITLAHRGVMFLDEICEFSRDNIDGLRIPLEEKRITHFRRGEAYTFPCDFQLVMASNPCPCGFYGDDERVCKCSQADIERYQKKLSGPIMDRIDMKISMERVSYKDLTVKQGGMNSEQMRQALSEARDFARELGRCGYNSELKDAELQKYCKLGDDERKFIKDAYESLSLSPRAYIRTVKVARTIADLDASEEIKVGHIAEALSYRMN